MENEAFENDKPGCVDDPSFDDDRAKLELHCVDEASSDWASPPQPDNASPGTPPASFDMTQPMTLSQPQQQVVVVEAHPTPGIPPVTNARVQPTVGTTGACVLACFVSCFCNPVFGAYALKFAEAARKSALAGHTAQAKDQRQSSYFLSIAGIVIGVFIIACVAGSYGHRAATAAAATTTVRPRTSTYRMRMCYSYGIYYYC